MDNLQMGRSGVSWVASVDSIGVNSMMKSAKICPFYRCPWFVPDVELTQLYSPLYQLLYLIRMLNSFLSVGTKVVKYYTTMEVHRSFP